MGGLDIPPESFKADRHIVHADEEPLRGTRQLLQHGPNCDINKKGAGEERRSQRGCCNGGGFITTGQHFLIKRKATTCTNGFSLSEPDWLGLTGCASLSVTHQENIPSGASASMHFKPDLQINVFLKAAVEGVVLLCCLVCRLNAPYRHSCVFPPPFLLPYTDLVRCKHGIKCSFSFNRSSKSLLK